VKTDQDTIKVWDPVVRIGHWTLVLAFFTAYFTEDDFMTQHVWAGYVVGAVVCFRMLWGFMGTKHARFKDFIVSPAAVLRYVNDLRNKSSKRYIGHNPAGGAMIIALLLSLAATVYTGMALYAVEDHAGPLAALFAKESPASESSVDNEASRESKASGNAPSGMAETKVHKAKKVKDPREDFWEELHEFFTNLTLTLVILHIAGGLFSSYLYKENLIRAMFTGRKRP